ncbi:hypothetical protein, partial [Riemerella anatipestifer]|uniref:hypothetical protein n=1 Tax=Riemerella anatipestifer TaxID=34085 RepID=UPI001F1C4D53
IHKFIIYLSILNVIVNADAQRSGIAEGGAFQHPTSNKIQYFKGKQIFLKCKYPPLAAIPCYMQ